MWFQSSLLGQEGREELYILGSWISPKLPHLWNGNDDHCFREEWSLSNISISEQLVTLPYKTSLSSSSLLKKKKEPLSAHTLKAEFLPLRFHSECQVNWVYHQRKPRTPEDLNLSSGQITIRLSSGGLSEDSKTMETVFFFYLDHSFSHWMWAFLLLRTRVIANLNFSYLFLAFWENIQHMGVSGNQKWK